MGGTGDEQTGVHIPFFTTNPKILWLVCPRRRPTHLPGAERSVSDNVSQGPPGTLELLLLFGCQVGRPLHPGVEARPLPAALDHFEPPPRPAARRDNNKPRNKEIEEKRGNRSTSQQELVFVYSKWLVGFVGNEQKSLLVWYPAVMCVLGVVGSPTAEKELVAQPR